MIKIQLDLDIIDFNSTVQAMHVKIRTHFDEREIKNLHDVVYNKIQYEMNTS